MSHLYILLALVGLSILSSAFKKFQEQAEKNRLASARRRAEEEALRTGRTPGEPLFAPPSAAIAAPPPTLDDEQSARARDLAARRQALVAELRRRAAAAAAGGGGGAAAGGFVPPVPAPVPAPVIERATSGYQPPPHVAATTMAASPMPVRTASTPSPQPASTPQRSNRAARVMKAQQQQQIQQQQRRQQQAPRGSRGEGPVDSKRSLRANATETPGASTPGRVAQVTPVQRFAAGKISLAELRRAIVLQEVLSPPVALREGTPGSPAV